MKACKGKQNKHFYEFGPFRVDTVKRRLIREGHPVPLTPKALDTVVVLLEHHGQAVEKDELIEAVWPDIAVEENNLTQNIYALRKALGDSPTEGRYVLTIPGWGYRFVADVREVSGLQTESASPQHTVTHIVIGEETIAQQLDPLSHLHEGIHRDVAKLVNAILNNLEGIDLRLMELELRPLFEDGINEYNGEAVVLHTFDLSYFVGDKQRPDLSDILCCKPEVPRIRLLPVER